MTALIITYEDDKTLYYDGKGATPNDGEALEFSDHDAVRKADQLNMLGYLGKKWVAYSLDDES